MRRPILAAVAGAGVVAIAGVRDVWGLLLTFGILFSFVVNVRVAWRIYQGNPKMMGGAVAHIGLAVMFLGFLASSEYDTERTVSLPQGRPVEVEGYRLMYTGYRPVEGGRFAFDVAVDREGKSRTVSPVMYESAFTQSIMRIPDILNLISHDLYVAPQGLEQPGAESAGRLETLSFRMNETKKLGAFTVTFLGFVLPGGHGDPTGDAAGMRIGARFSVARDGGKAVIVEPAKLIRQGESSDVPVRMEERFEFVLASIHPDMERRENSTAVLGMRDLAGASGGVEPDVLVAEVSVKPYINLVWGGLIVLLVGFGVTLLRRVGEAAPGRPLGIEEG
jgi:cytochrome c-type biogenesis protein CcmF